MILRRALILSLLSLAACGSPSTPPPADPGTLFPARFGDSDSVDFNGRNPQSYPVHGIDVARFQNNIDWNTARQNGVNFAFIKATEGGDLKDINFDTHWQGAGQAAVKRGAYHFYYFCTSPEDQARWFIRNVPRTPGMLPPVLDMEWNPFSPTCAHIRPPAAEVRDQMRRWLAVVERHYGQRPIIYTTPEFYRQNGLNGFTGYDFWLRTTAKAPAEAYPGQTWRFWQYSATGIVPGIGGDVDINAFSGSRVEWQNWVATHALR